MNVTLYSDASLCPVTQLVGWASWVKSDRGTTLTQGVLRARLLDTSIAEAMAAMNAISHALKSGAIRTGDIVVISTDNDAVMSILEGVAKRRCKPHNLRKRGINFKQMRTEVKLANQHIQQIASVYLAKRDEHQLDVRWTHVKGHRGTVDRRAAVNHSCDRRAREQMNEAREANNFRTRKSRAQRKNKKDLRRLPAKVLD